MTLRRWLEIVIEDTVMIAVFVPTVMVIKVASAVVHNLPTTFGYGPKQSRPS